MAVQTDGAPSWLFSFVDLAFLMLIAMTQLANDVDPQAVDLGEMVVPRIGSESTGEMQTGASKAWQLRVHPLAPEPDQELGAFELVVLGGGPDEEPLRFAEVAGLRDELGKLASRGGSRPLLAPHENSRSQDLLDAAALIEEFWPGRRRVTVARVFEP